MTKTNAGAVARTGGRGRRRLAVSRTTRKRAIGTPVALFYRANSQASSDSEQPEIYLTGELRFWPSAAFTERADAGNCSTVAC